ncbi:MAG: hypothetical protein R3C68_06075 [Myxococcota bacterium]
MAIPSKLKQMVGKATRPAVFEIEKGQSEEEAVAKAIAEDNPIHSDVKAAKAAGIPLPLLTQPSRRLSFVWKKCSKTV